MDSSGALDDRQRRSVRALLVTVFATATASIAQATVLGKQVYDLTDSKLALGILGLVEFLPAALLILVTGTVADRLDRRRIAAVAAGGEAIASALLAWYASTKPTSATPICENPSARASSRSQATTAGPSSVSATASTLVPSTPSTPSTPRARCIRRF